VITLTSSRACEELRMWRLQSWKALHLFVTVNAAHLSLAGIVPDVL
jgi:EAL domain-containing protein (putative c-di-GMP-specific phosphodiesterase class I)